MAVSPTPFLWEEKRALNFFQTYNWISVFHSKSHAMSREMIMVIFFEETGFSNVQQDKGKGPAVGFGQMQIYDRDKIPFFETLGFNSDKTKKDSPLPLITPEKIINDNMFSINMFCKYYQWLSDVHGKSKQGILEAQVGNHTDIIPLWLKAESMLKPLVLSTDRMGIINALNQGKRPKTRIPYNNFKSYWDFTLPEKDLMWGIRE